MVAVVFVSHAYGTLLPWGWVIGACSLVLVALGLQVALPKRPARIALGALVAVTLIGIAWPVMAQLICPSCSGCDPFWLEFFWICV